MDAPAHAEENPRNNANVYKILTRVEWEYLRDHGEFLGTNLDRADGFIHLSTADQVKGTLEKHFHAHHEVVVAAFDPGQLAGELRYELSRDSQCFPHLYGTLTAAAIVSHQMFTRQENGTFRPAPANNPDC